MNAANTRMLGTTFSIRLQTVAEEVEILNKVQAPYEKTAMIIRSTKIPKALYGVEAAPVNERLLQVLMIRFKQALTYTTKQRSADVAFATCSHGPDLDPDIYMLLRSATALGAYIARSKDEDMHGGSDHGALASSPSSCWWGQHGALASGWTPPSHLPLAWKDAAMRNQMIADAIYKGYEGRLRARHTQSG